jgi:sulfatase maturation enzyme AslB (radical SAM superfamily)
MSEETAKGIIKNAFAENNTVCEEIKIDFMGGEPLLEFAYTNGYTN